MKVALVGGGTGGHIIPALALAAELQGVSDTDTNLIWIGDKGELTGKLVKEAGIKFYAIPTGKLRRYFSWITFLDAFRIIGGFWKSIYILLKEKPQIVFSKGGYVSVPVASAAWILRIPIITHESDLVPGLATRIISKFAKKVCVAFRESQKYFPAKAVFTGNPVRPEILRGDKELAYKLTGFDASLPVILIMGGSLGAKSINEALELTLPELCKKAQVLHITGKHKLNYEGKNYFAAEFIGAELKDVYAICDIVVARAGAGTLFELAAVSKATILIPLGPPASRGEQIENARAFEKVGAAVVLEQKDLSAENLMSKLENLLSNQEKQKSLQTSIHKFYEDNASRKIVEVLEKNEF